MSYRLTHVAAAATVVRRIVATTAAASALLAVVAPTNAQFKFWDPALPSDGNWHNGTNWSPPGVPSVNDEVRILIADVVRLTADSTPPWLSGGIDGLLLEGGADLSTNGHRLYTLVGSFPGGFRDDFTTVRGQDTKMRVQSGGSPNDFDTGRLTLEDGGQLLLEGGTARVGDVVTDLTVDALSAMTGQGALHAARGVANSGTIDIDGEITIDGELANAGIFRLSGQGEIGDGLDNQLDGELIIDNAVDCCNSVLTVHGIAWNEGTIELTSQTEQDSVLELTGGFLINRESSTLRLTGPDDLDGDGTIDGKRIIRGTVSNWNLGSTEILTNTQIEGQLGIGVDAETLIDNADVCCDMTVEVTEGITNHGTFAITTQQQAVTLQLGAGQTLQNSTSGVVNLEALTDAGSPPAHTIVGDVVNEGRFNLRTNTQIDGALENQVDAETIIDNANICCDITIDVTEGVANSGNFTMAATAVEEITMGVTAEHSFVNEVGGTLSGVGTIAGSLINSGTVAPGNSTGLLAVTGDFTQTGDGVLVIEATGTTPGQDYDQLAIGADVTLDGIVQLIVDGFEPAPGDAFEVITSAASLAGRFSDAFLPGLPEGMAWQEDYQPGAFSLRVVEELPGDFNGDGIINAADYTVWRDGLGDEFDAGDYEVWKQSFGATAASGATLGSTSRTAIPEPASLLVLVIGAAMMARGRFGRRLG